MNLTIATTHAGAPERRPLALRPRAPRPAGRGPDNSIGSLGRVVTKAIRPFQQTAPGNLLRGMLRRSCALRSVEVELARGGPELDGFRLALLSDLHVGFFFSETEFAEVAHRISAWQPDLICLVGDLVDQQRDELELLGPGLAALQARDAVLAVPGNHDYAADPTLEVFRGVMEHAGVVPLWNRGIRVRRGGSSLWVSGVDDLTAGEPDLEAALDDLRGDEPAVLLSHHPDLFCEAAYAGVDLTLSGHTHGGQITWFGRALIPGHEHTQFGYWQGLHRDGGAQLVVSRGVGVCVLPVRVAAAPEVLLIELRTAPRIGPL